MHIATTRSPSSAIRATISYSGNAYGGAIEWTWTARHRAPFLDLPAEGKETRIRGVSVVRCKAEKIVEQRDYWDARTLIQQLDGGAGEAQQADATDGGGLLIGRLDAKEPS